MPVTVVVRSANQAEGEAAGDAPSLTFDGPRIVIGRGAGSDVRLPDASVSLRHATIRANGAEYAIVDEGSTNGTWVGGVKLVPQTPRLVKPGDLVRVGRVWLELTMGHRPATPDLGLATRDLALAFVRRAMNAVGDDTTTKVRVAEGPDLGVELRLAEEGKAYVIGRAEQCDLPLADADASREHAAVLRRGGQVFLRDLGAKNGVFLGDTRLAPEREVVWRNTTMARVGQTVLALDEPVSVALAELEAADDEPLREEDAAPPPSTPAQPSQSAPPSAGPPPSEIGIAAPIAEVAMVAAPAPAPAPRRSARRSWTLTDLLVVALAVSVIGASLAGLVWVLR